MLANSPILLASTLIFLVSTTARSDESKAKPEPTKARVEAPKPKADAPKPKADAPKPKADTAKADAPKPKADAPKAKPKSTFVPPAKPTVSFLKDVAPLLVQNCIACHNPKKSESKYVMTNYAQLAKGGQKGEGITLEPGNPEESYFVELIRHDGDPRMPYKQDPLTPEKIGIIEKWVKEGAVYDGKAPTEDWTIVLRRTTTVTVPDAYTVTVPITAVAFGPKGAELAVSGYHEVNLFKAVDGNLARRLRPLPERIYDIAYTADGKWMATASGDPGQFGTVKLWSVDAGGDVKPARDLLETNDCVFAVAFSPDGKTLAAAGADRAIRIWEVATGKELALIEDHADWIFDLAFSPDGKRLASASRDKTAKVFDVAKKESLVTFPGHAETVYTVGFTADGKQIATGGGDNQIRFWNPDEDAKQASTIGGFGGAVFKLQLLPDGKTMVAAGADKNVRVYENKTLKQTLSGHNDWIYSLAVAPDGKSIASGSWDGEVRLWSLPDGKPIKTILAAPGFKPAAQAAK